jgi:hypothetical protein
MDGQNNGTIPMFDAQGNLGDLPAQNMQAAMQQGGYRAAVSVVDPNGQTGYVPSDKLHDALMGGYTLTNPSQGKPTPELKKLGALDAGGGWSIDDLWRGAVSGVKNMFNPAGYGQSAVASGVAPGGMYPTTAYVPEGSNQMAHANENNRAVQVQAQHEQAQAARDVANNPMYTVGTVAGPAVLTAGVAKGAKLSAGVAGDALGAVSDFATDRGWLVDPADRGAVNAAPKTGADISTVNEIQQTHLPELHKRIGGALDSAASQITDAAGKPVDTTGIQGLSDKAAAAGDAYKSFGQRIYGKLDAIAKNIVGKDWSFQKLGTDVQDLQHIIDDPETTTADRVDAQQRLKVAEQNLDTFEKAAEVEATKQGFKGVKDMRAQADKAYSQGLSFDDTGRALRKGERLEFDDQGNPTRRLAPNNEPLDAAIRSITDRATKRFTKQGRTVAQNALGSDASVEIQRAAHDAAEKIAADKAAATRGRAAQVRIKDVRNTQWNAAKATAALAGGAGAVKATRALAGK